MAQRPAGEAVFNIFQNLLVGADAKLQSDLQLDIPVGDSTNAYINLDQHRDVWGWGGVWREGGRTREGKEGREVGMGWKGSEERGQNKGIYTDVAMFNLIDDNQSGTYVCYDSLLPLSNDMPVTGSLQGIRELVCHGLLMTFSES